MSSQLAVLAPDLKRGVRAALVTVVPFFLAQELARPELTWTALGGWFAVLADPGGVTRSRARAMLTFLAVATGALALAMLLGRSLIGVLACITVATFFGSVVRVFGGGAAAIGTLTAIVVAVTTGSGIATSSAPGMFALGVLWQIAMSSIVWPTARDRPGLLAVAQVYAKLADFAEAIAIEVAFSAGSAKDVDHAGWPELARKHHRDVRSAIEAARTILIELRARRAGESMVGANARVLLGDAELEFFRLIAYADALEAHLGRAGAESELEILRVLRDRFDAIAFELRSRRTHARPPTAPSEARHAVARDLTGDLLAGTERSLALSRDLDVAPAAAERSLDRPVAAIVVRDMMTWRSPIFQHAVRASAAAIAATILGRALSPHHAQWVTITTIAVVQPYLGPTLKRVLERVLGTIAGVAVALLLVEALMSPLAITLAMFVLVVLSIVTRPRSYRLFVAFLTPVFLLVADHGHPGTSTALARVADVALGGAVGVIAAFVPPSWEKRRLPEQLAAAIAALSRYVAVATASLEHAGSRSPLTVARREVGVALETAEVTLERALAEPPPVRWDTASAVFILTHVRRLATGLTALDEARRARSDTSPIAGVAAVRAYLLAVLDATERFITTGMRTLVSVPPQVDPALLRLVHHAELLASGQRHRG